MFANGCRRSSPTAWRLAGVAAAPRLAVTAATLLYGQNWEDSAIELEALKVGPDDRVIAVGGAGCTVLSLLAQRPRQLYAIDRNAAQLHLLRLKFAAVLPAPTGTATAFLGGTEDHARLATFQMLAPHLDADTAQFWRPTRRRSNTGSSRKGESSATSGRFAGCCGLSIRAAAPSKYSDSFAPGATMLLR